MISGEDPQEDPTVYSLALKIMRNVRDDNNYISVTYCWMFYPPSVVTVWEIQCHNALLIVSVPSFHLLLEELQLNCHGPSRNAGNRNCCHAKVIFWDKEVFDSITLLTYSWISSKPMSSQRDNKIGVDFLKLRRDLTFMLEEFHQQIRKVLTAYVKHKQEQGNYFKFFSKRKLWLPLSVIQITYLHCQCSRASFCAPRMQFEAWNCKVIDILHAAAASKGLRDWDWSSWCCQQRVASISCICWEVLNMQRGHPLTGWQLW